MLKFTIAGIAPLSMVALALLGCATKKEALIIEAPAPTPAAEPIMAAPEAVMIATSAGGVAPDSVPSAECSIPDPDPNHSYRYFPMREGYNPITDNVFQTVTEVPLSTFSIDVDTASYSNVRRYVMEWDHRPPADAVRIEELINYFDYDYPFSEYRAGEAPFKSHVAVAECPWATGHKLVRVGIKGCELPKSERPESNLVFLIDVSGSMNSPDKLPLVKQGLNMLTGQLGENDRVAIVVYAGSSSVALEPTKGSNARKIREAIENLSAGGSTHGSQGIQQAYAYAREGFIEGGINRVILASDGDFNVGVTSQDELIAVIEKEAQSGVFLTVLGFGTGNLQDGTMEQLANKGNGMYAYIDTLREAKKVFIDQMQGSLITIAKDVKIQVEFNPERAHQYRLIGYENRLLAAQDFNDDSKDAGEIGAGHTVTALYEVIPPGTLPQPGVDPLKYQVQPEQPKPSGQYANELMTLEIRYKEPEADESKLIEYPVIDASKTFDDTDDDFRFAASVAAFGMLLRGSENTGDATFDKVITWASGALGTDPHGYRAEFLDIVRKATVVN